MRWRLQCCPGAEALLGTVKHRYEPSQAAPPGRLVQEYLDALDISARELGRRCGRSAKLVVEIIAGKAPIEPETALQLERVLGLAADAWLGMEANYRLHLAKISEQSRLTSDSDWVSRFPLKELERRGYVNRQVPPGELVRQMLGFFGAGSADACRQRFKELAAVSYRHSPSFRSAEESLLVWLRLGEREAEAIEAADFERATFLKQLREIRRLTTHPVDEFMPEMRERCARAGVAFVVIKPLQGVALSGISRWLTPRKAIIQQSLRHMANDHFWFTFYHEAAHLLLHSRKTIFLDGKGYSSASSQEEDEANNWSANFLVPQGDLQDFINNFQGSQSEILSFSAAQGIAPGIVVGQLQKRGVLRFNQMNHLKVRFQWLG
jgi:HTH-type transcriptional regulator/antitoxin HigA